jgi:hypothetical protein
MKRINKLLTMLMILFLMTTTLTGCDINVSGKSYGHADYSYKYTEEGKAYADEFCHTDPEQYLVRGMINPFNRCGVFFYTDGSFGTGGFSASDALIGTWSDIGDSIKVDIADTYSTRDEYKEYVGKTIYFKKTINGLKLDVLELEPELSNHFTKLEYIFEETGKVR